MTKARKLVGRKRDNISSKDRGKGLPGLQMVSSLVALSIPLLHALGRTPKDGFGGRLQPVGAARLGPRTAAARTGCGQL